MREILFRGKRLDTKEWVYGGYTVWGNMQHVIYKYGKYGENNAYEVYPDTVGQYTGFCDRNSVKIFDGDIIEFTDDEGGTCLYDVKWNDKMAGWCITPQGDPNNTITMDDWEPDRWRVIGNQWDKNCGGPTIKVQFAKKVLCKIKRRRT